MDPNQIQINELRDLLSNFIALIKYNFIGMVQIVGNH